MLSLNTYPGIRRFLMHTRNMLKTIINSLNTYPGIRRFLIIALSAIDDEANGLNTYPGIRRFLIMYDIFKSESMPSQYLSRYS